MGWFERQLAGSSRSSYISYEQPFFSGCRVVLFLVLSWFASHSLDHSNYLVGALNPSEKYESQLG